MSDSGRTLVDDELDAIGEVLQGRSGGSGLAKLLSADQHVATLTDALFRPSRVLKRAAMAHLLGRLKRVAVSHAELRSAERAVAALDALEKSTRLALPAASLGRYAADFIVGRVLRGERAPEVELETLFAGHPGNIRTTLEAARAACILDEVLLTFVAMRERGQSVTLSETLVAVTTVVDSDIEAASDQKQP